jgi:hypothetical protein
LFSVINCFRFPNRPLQTAIFALSDVRAAAREGTIEVPEDIQILPVTTNAIIEAFRANEETLEKILKKADYAILKNLSLNTSVILDGMDSDEKVAIAMLKECTFNYFGDDNVGNDCVYTIFKNTLNKRITVCFRGSITLQDWIKDSKVFVDDIPNPLSDRPDQPPTIGVHLGFKEYLYGESNMNDIDAIKSSIGSFMSTPGEDRSSSAAGTSEATNGSSNEPNGWNIKIIGSAFAKWKEKAGLSGKTNNEDVVGGINTVSCVDGSDFGEEDVCDNNDLNGNDKNRNDEDEKENCDNGDNDKNDDDDSPKPSATMHGCRLKKILEEIRNLYEENEDYSIYITGHSLGGALGLLTALEAGTHFGKPGLPVTYVGIANPRGGTVRVTAFCIMISNLT